MYFILIVAIPSNEEIGANQLQTNILRVQRFAFDIEECPYVIVGSSESARIPAEIVSENLYNLALSGESALTGLEIINNKTTKPEIVFVELNKSILKGADELLLEKTSDWNALIFNRECYRMDYLFRCLYQPFYNMIKSKQVITLENTDENLFNIYYNDYQTLLDETSLEMAIQDVQTQIDKLEMEGTRIVLLEVPLDMRLYDTPQYLQVRTALEEAFPDTNYEWFRVSWQEYTTTDGIHMGNNSVIRYAEKLKTTFFE